jgi:hypothetical protein
MVERDARCRGGCSRVLPASLACSLLVHNQRGGSCETRKNAERLTPAKQAYPAPVRGDHLTLLTREDQENGDRSLGIDREAKPHPTTIPRCAAPSVATPSSRTLNTFLPGRPPMAVKVLLQHILRIRRS